MKLQALKTKQTAAGQRMFMLQSLHEWAIWWCAHTDTEWQNFPREKLSDEHRSTIRNFHPQSFTFSKQIQVQPSDTWPSLCICSCYWLKSPDKSQHKQQVGGSESFEEGTLAGFEVALRNSWLQKARWNCNGSFLVSFSPFCTFMKAALSGWSGQSEATASSWSG